ncbi:MAG: glycerol kinase [Actinomycetota bacterium]|jgi:glycerol kinase|nr:glycerol kinase [Actinomycetota bacterium]
MPVLAIDAGTTGVTALVVGEDGRVVSRGYQEFAQHFPRPGWVEHEPEEIWVATLQACRLALRDQTVTCIGITNQRETAVVWDRTRLSAPRRAIVWQDRRTTEICERLKSDGHEARVAELTGLRLDPYFTATKLTWLKEHDEASWRGITDGSLWVGTVDSYVVARLTGGARHVTDASNASRTLLFDLRAGGWSEELCSLFGVPVAALPEVVASYGEIGRSDPDSFLGLDLPIAGIAGDQQAALFGQGCYDAGRSKCTYGTGSFVLVNTGETPVLSDRLLTTVAWMRPDGALVYALEGSVFVTGSAVQWLRDGLQIIGSAAEIESLAASVPDSGGVVFVPALTGLGAPHWDPEARGTVLGITRGTTRAHLARATLDAIAFEVRDVVDAMTNEAGLKVPQLQVDGGASANNLLCQLQADQLGVPVQRPEVLETTALGAAFLAGLGTGVWSSQDELAETWKLDRRFEPAAGVRDDGRHAQWLRGVDRSKGWAL